MKFHVIFSPEAEKQLIDLYWYIAEEGSPSTALRYTDAIVDYCESLSEFPHRGHTRDDIRAGLRITNYRKTAVIAFDVDGKSVSIVGNFYGGQDYEKILLGDADDSGSNN